MPKGKGKAPAKQSSLRAAGLLPTLMNVLVPHEAQGLAAHAQDVLLCPQGPALPF
jgi:hypothetical protein